MDDKVLATITTFNPDMELLKSNIESVIDQVDKLIVYENASDNRDEISELCKEKNIELILNDKNCGVAGPLYDGIVYATAHGFRYILTLDQDSISSEGMVSYLKQILLSDETVAVAAANPTYSCAVIKEEPKEDYKAMFTITSGSLYDVAKISEIGNYIREMFIDWVDIEISYRIRENNYTIIQAHVPIYHNLGNPQLKRFLWKKFFVTNHSSLRLYYIWRNAHYCLLRYKDKSLNKHCKRDMLKRKIKVMFFERNRREKLKAIKRGKRDAKEFYKKIKEKYSFL